MVTEQEKEFLQIYQNADDAGKGLLFGMLLCFAYCGEDFINEIQEVQGDKDEMMAVIAKHAAALSEVIAV